MGISANDFWARSQNGKAMLVFLARQEKFGLGNNIELVRDICDWLVGKHKNDLIAGALSRGATMEQAKAYGNNQTSGLQNMADSISDRNAEANAVTIIDAVFHRHYNAGKQQYERAMAWFADELRKRVKDDKR